MTCRLMRVPLVERDSLGGARDVRSGLVSAHVPVCPSCNAKNTRRIGAIPGSNLFAGQVLDAVLDGGELWACPHCYLMFRYPRLSDSELSALYEAGAAEAWGSVAEEREDWVRAAAWIAEHARPGDSVLDVGCSTGKFLSEALGDSYQKFGVEKNLNAGRVATAAGVSILATEIDTMWGAMKGMSFNVVTAFDVIEHVGDPLAFLEAIASILAPDGRIIIATGNTQSLSWRLMGARYWYCVIPEHIAFISPAWCLGVQNRTRLRLTKIEYYSHGRQAFRRRATEVLKNISYKYLPGLARRMRRFGLGQKDAKTNPELSEHPPSWLSARDHLIAEFRVVDDR